MSTEQDLDAFREEARQWLKDNLPQSLAHQRPPGIAGFGAKLTGDWKVWQERLGEKGWSAPTWPAAYGGGGLTPEQASVLAAEMAEIGAFNPIGGFGIMMWGPTLLDVGTEAQGVLDGVEALEGDVGHPRSPESMASDTLSL